MSGSFTDAETIDVSSTDWVPTKAAFTTAINCRTAGTLYVDMVGTGWSAVGVTVPGSTNVPITMVAGEVIYLAIVKAHHTSSTGTYSACYGPGL
jgi:hypothetical protein